MLKQHLGSLTPAGSDADIMSLQTGQSLQARQPLQACQVEAPLQPDRDDDGMLAQTVRDQLAREVADIEAATAVLRRAEPALESWTTEPVSPNAKPRPVWLLIGVVWLSTALVTVGAVVAIATFAG